MPRPLPSGNGSLRRWHASARRTAEPDPSGRWTPPCAPRATPDPWCAPWRQWRSTTAPGRGTGSSRRCSRLVRWPATSNWGSSSARSWRPWCGRWPSGTGSSGSLVPCGPGSSTTSPARTVTTRSSWGPVDCGMSSSPFSCCSWCTVGRTHLYGYGPPSTPCAACRQEATSVEPMPSDCCRHTDSNVSWNTASSCSTYDAPTCSPPTRPPCGVLPAGSGCAPVTMCAKPGTPPPRPCCPPTTGCSTPRWSRPSRASPPRNCA